MVGSLKTLGTDRHKLVVALQAKISEYSQTIQEHEQPLREWVVDRDYLEGLLARFQKVVEQEPPIAEFKDTIFQ